MIAVLRRLIRASPPDDPYAEPIGPDPYPLTVGADRVRITTSDVRSVTFGGSPVTVRIYVPLVSTIRSRWHTLLGD